MKKLSAIFLLAVVCVTGCIKRENTTTDGGQTSPTGPTTTAPVSFQRVTRGTRSAFAQQTTFVATSDRTFDDLLARTSPDEPIRTPNFTHEMAIGVFLGERLTGGFSFRVTNVTDSDGVLTIEATETIPNLRCAVTQSLTQPFDIIAVPRKGNSVVLSLTREIGPPCF